MWSLFQARKIRVSLACARHNHQKENKKFAFRTPACMKNIPRAFSQVANPFPIPETPKNLQLLYV